MKMKLLIGGGGLCATALAGIAVAQAVDGGWPQISLIDLEQCRPVIAQAHDLEKRYVRQAMSEACDPRIFSRTSCQTERRRLANTKAKDDVVWYFEGNDRCSNTDYPCFGVQPFNEVKTGEEAAHWRQVFQTAASKPFGMSPKMDVWGGVREADKCVARIWTAKYGRAHPPVIKTMSTSEFAALSHPVFAGGPRLSAPLAIAGAGTPPQDIAAESDTAKTGASPAADYGASVAASAASATAALAQPAISAAPAAAAALTAAPLAVTPVAAAAALAPVLIAVVGGAEPEHDAAKSEASPGADPGPPPAAPAADPEATAKTPPPEPPTTPAANGAEALATAKLPEPAPAEADAAAKPAELAGGPAATPVVAPGGCDDDKADAVMRVGACSAALAAVSPQDPAYEGLLANRMAALAGAGRPAEAIADGDKLAAAKGGGDGKLIACKARVLARQQLDRALIACFSTGKSDDPEVLGLRGQIHLLAGRFQDAWNDFNLAWTAGKAYSALFLRGLAAAGAGKTASALKDMAQAEEGQEGLLESYEAKGYSLIAVLSHKPLVGPEALVDAPAAAIVEPAPARPAAPPPAASEQAPARKSATPVSAVPTAFLAGAGASAAGAAAAAAALPPAVAVPPAPIVPLLDQHEPVLAPGATIKGVGDTGNLPKVIEAVLTPEEMAKPVTDCLEPLQEGDRTNPSDTDVFKNKCDYQVRFTYCNVQLPDSGPNEPFACGNKLGMKFDVVVAKGVQSAHLGRQVAYFGCRGSARPDLVYTADKGLFGYCR